MDDRRVLVAEDDPTCARILEVSLAKWGYEAVTFADGRGAWDMLQENTRPSLAIIDWMMPGMDGVEICAQVRSRPELAGMYLILLTTRDAKEDVVEGLGSGADDYVIKPFNIQEMRARVQVGMRVLSLQKSLEDRIAELERAAASIKQLQGLLPMCAWCKSIRNDQNYWERVEQYLSDHAGARFSHGICPSCYEKVMGDIEADRARAR
ncbi:MAG: response regulator [Deltaproteobacteria bacterium]|nr:response regulator [Deltaproteobacteria bacterium]